MNYYYLISCFMKPLYVNYVCKLNYPYLCTPIILIPNNLLWFNLKYSNTVSTLAVNLILSILIIQYEMPLNIPTPNIVAWALTPTLFFFSFNTYFLTSFLSIVFTFIKEEVRDKIIEYNSEKGKTNS